MRSPLRRVAIAAATVATAAIVAACSGHSTNQTTAGNQTSQTTYSEFTAKVPYPYQAAAPSNPLERENLAKRLKQYNSAGDTNYVYVFTYAGQVMGYYVINGKVSSTGSQMTATQISCYNDGGAGCVMDAIGDDGSYGPEEGGQAGVFFYTATGVLVETDLPFLVSSSPVTTYANAPQLDAKAGK